MNNIKIKVKTSEAEDRVLNYLVGKCEGRNPAVTRALFVQQRTPIFPTAHLFLGLN
jgi:hypothetical protein